MEQKQPVWKEALPQQQRQRPQGPLTEEVRTWHLMEASAQAGFAAAEKWCAENLTR